MAELVVQPAIQLQPTDIITVDKLNLLGTPVVSLSLETPVSDANYFRNGNFYSSFWNTPGGMSCPVGVETQNANYWTVNPNGAPLTCKRSTDVPDLYSLFSLELDGAAGVAGVSLGQQINGDLSATLRRDCTFSGNIENNSGTLLSPTLEIWTANTFNNFNNVTLQDTVNLQTVPVGAWAYVTATIDLSASSFQNVANGLLIKVRLPAGALSQVGFRINFSRIKWQLGEVATGFVDDVALFVQAPSVDSTMLQDGCIARPSLFLPSVIPKGAFEPGVIQSGDIGIGQVEAANLDPGISTTTTAGFTVPAINASANITLASASGISPGLVLNIQGAGLYAVQSVSANLVTAQNTGGAGNTAPGTVVNSGASVSTNGNAVLGCLGYTPINKAGDSGVGIIEFDVDVPLTSVAPPASGVYLKGTTGNAHNDQTFPAIGFARPGVFSRALGLETTGRFKTIDGNGLVGYMLDTVTGVDTHSYQPSSITWQALAQSLINIICPTGMVRMFAGPSPPAAWLVCDGSQYLQSLYPALFAAIGAYWGAGGAGASAWFKVPDFRGRAPVGYVNSAVSGITGRGFGTLWGEEAHVLSGAELAYHNHGVADQQHTHSTVPHDHGWSDPGHHHSYNTYGNMGTHGGGTFPNWEQVVGANTSQAYTGINFVGEAVGVNAAYTGINATDYYGANYGHNNMQPSACLYFIIKT